MSIKYRIIAPSGAIRDNLTEQDVRDFRKAKIDAGKSLDGFQVESYDDGSKSSSSSLAPHQKRQQKYGTLGSMFPYTYDQIDRYGELNAQNAIPRGLAIAKDIASYPGRIAAGGLDYLVNRDNSLGKTSEEAMRKGLTVGGILRNPLTPLSLVPGLAPVSVGEAVGMGAAFGAADAAISQPYDGETDLGRLVNIAKGAAIGAGFGLLPTAVPLFKAIKGKLKGLLSEPATKETLDQVRELANIIFRGKASKQLSNRETDQLIESQKEVFDNIASRMDRKSLEGIRDNTENTLFNEFGKTKIPYEDGRGMVGRNDYITRDKMSGMPTSEERGLIEEMDEVKKSLASSKREGNKGAIAEDSKRLSALKKEVDNAKEGRPFSYMKGEDQLLQAPKNKGQHSFTDKTTEKFFRYFNSNMDDTITKMSGTWKTEGGRLRRNSKGQVIPGTPEQLGNRANYYINYLSDKIQARSRGVNTGVAEKSPRITNEDIAVTLQEMGRNNEWEFMDALLDACTWLTQEVKEGLKYNAILNKASVNALDALGVTPVSAANKSNAVVYIAGNLPKVGKYIKGIAALGDEVGRGWPKDFSARYKAMQNGAPYSVDFMKTPNKYVVPGLVVTSGLNEK